MVERAANGLKVKAIDAFMMGPGSPKGDNSRWITSSPIGGLCYTWGSVAEWDANPSGRVCIQRPRGDGERGGELIGPSRKEGYIEDFNRIRAEVERSTDRWQNLPKPERIQQWRDEFRPVVACFGIMTYDENGNASLNPLWTDLDNAHRILGRDLDGNGMYDESEVLLRGGAIDAFRGYFQGLVNAACACAEIVQVVNKSLEAEQALWEMAGTEAVGTIDHIADICGRLAAGGPEAGGVEVDAGDLLTGISQAFGIASVVPGPHQLATGAVGLGLSFVAVAVGSGSNGSAFDPFEYVNPSRPPIPNYSGALEVLSLLLNGSEGSLAEIVTNVEDNIARTVRAATWTITTTECYRFNPRAAPITEVPPTLRHDRELALNVVHYTARVAEALCTAATDVKACCDLLDHSVLERHERIGIGYGLYQSLSTLMFLLRMTIQELGDEAYAAAANLQAVVEALDRSEADRQTLIQTAADSFAAADSGYVRRYSDPRYTPLDAVVEVPEPVIPDIDRMRKEGLP
ncbi:MAG: hypothetical protein FWH11_05520 [Micrococcales bacterium]|nr:hypothetical protein [Micrococcales bacterium]